MQTSFLTSLSLFLLSASPFQGERKNSDSPQIR